VIVVFFCQQIGQASYCPNLSHPEHGEVQYDYGNNKRDIDSKAVYICEVGYQLNGNKHRICIAGTSWSGSTPTCELKLLCARIIVQFQV